MFIFDKFFMSKRKINETNNPIQDRILYLEELINEKNIIIKKLHDQNNERNLDLALNLLNGVQKNPDEGIKILKDVAELGNCEALCQLGMNYMKGIYTQPDIDMGLYFLREASENGSDKSDLILGYIYSKGEYVLENKKLAFSYFNKSAERNNIEAIHELAKFCYFGIYVEKNEEKAKSLILSVYKSIDYENSTVEFDYGFSYYILGLIFLEGYDDIIKDIDKSIDFFWKASYKGNILAKGFLGNLYYEGKIINKNIMNAIFLLRQAADNGHGYSQFLLGEIYFNNIDVERDLKLAIFWYTMADDNGISEVSDRLLLVKAKVEQNNSNLFQKIKNDANTDVKSQYCLAHCYCYGKGTEIDYNLAARWFQKASQANHTSSMFELGKLYYTGSGVPQNYKLALNWFKKASNNGSKESNEYIQKLDSMLSKKKN